MTIARIREKFGLPLREAWMVFRDIGAASPQCPNSESFQVEYYSQTYEGWYRLKNGNINQLYSSMDAAHAAAMKVLDNEGITRCRILRYSVSIAGTLGKLSYK